MPLVLPLAANWIGQTALAVTAIKQGAYVWKTDHPQVQLIPLLSSTEPLTLQLQGAVDGCRIKISRDGNQLGETLEVKDGTAGIPVEHPVLKSTSDQRLQLQLLVPNGQGQLQPSGSPVSINLRVPGAEPPLRPRITHVSNNKFVAPGPVSVQSTTSIYDRFLRIRGEFVREETDLLFHVFRRGATGQDYEFAGVAAPVGSIRRQDNGVWQVDLFLPEVPEASREYRLQVLATTSDKRLHNLAEYPLQLSGKNGKPLLDAKPTLNIARESGQTEGVPRKPSQTFQVTGTHDTNADGLGDARVAVFAEGIDDPVGVSKESPSNNEWHAEVTVKGEGTFKLQAAFWLGSSPGQRSATREVRVGTRPPRVASIEPQNLAFSPDRKTITVNFDPDTPINESQVVRTSEATALDGAAHFLLKGNTAGERAISTITFHESDNSVTIKFASEIPPDIYTFTVKGTVKSIFGIPMGDAVTKQLLMPVGAELPSVAPGISGATGPYVTYGEYTKPRPFMDGFNPSDHVETRVSRLYYFRDAHRAAQIVNREAKSHNRAAVDMQRQLADKARTIADQATDVRRAKEREAVNAAQKTREAERELQEAETLAAYAANHAANAAADQQAIEWELRNRPASRTNEQQAELERQANNRLAAREQLERVAESARRRAEAAFDKVQALRGQEAERTEAWQQSIAAEDRVREEQFRREVAAANADPDTYAPGEPGSEDPVRQVSVSVIGEGLIQLRGPIKGINAIRTMINQIDAPVGQVRVSVHTVQINGEKGDRMEVVAGKIQRYIDHSRFLTLQSAEMLRKAIVQVAAQRAMELGGLAGMTQEERDRKYLYSFFGEDFVRELEVMDSEFLKTGNKLLSLHSMDSTSLASAMFLMALAKNSTRLEILQTFEGMLSGQLPMAEQNYFEAGLTCDGKHKLFDKYCRRDDFQLLSGNARFQSIRGLFDAEIAADDTMTPIQREFVRLAQIFKSRLIVEMELKQRVMERAVIEERLGSREKDLTDARKKEERAEREKKNAQDAVRNAQKGALAASQDLKAVLQNAQQKAQATAQSLQRAQGLTSMTAARLTAEELLRRIAIAYKFELKERGDAFFVEEGRKLLLPLKDGESFGGRLYALTNTLFKQKNQSTLDTQEKDLFVFPDWPPTPPDKQPKQIKIWIPKSGSGKLIFDPAYEGERSELASQVADLATDAAHIGETLKTYVLDREHRKQLEEANQLLSRIRQADEGEEINNVVRARDVFDKYAAVAEYKAKEVAELYARLNQIVADLGQPDADFQGLYQCWSQLEQRILAELSKAELGNATEALERATESFRILLDKSLDYEFAEREAQASRRPLDHKKFLDMLVDEMEDKYIELLEGTRAHTANIDAYIKRLMTSLDDDFNTQFYYPTFRKVREASQFWDVQMGQVETTNVLANNRAFAKVTPQATMEFDLPKRDIVIAEAIDGAKAMIDDVGALAQDPTFLAMAKLNGGQPTSSPVAGSTGGFSTVRNVLPGLSTDTAEAVLGQQGPGGAQFGAALEGLIPDPAIYKFETGTGWEIRPVIQPDGQAVVFHFNYMYSTNIREPIRADEKHLGRVKRHFVDTDVQLSNYELREVSRYTVALKAARTSRGVPLFEDIPVAGVLFRPLPNAESSLQQNIILSQATIFPTLFDLMGLRWAPVVADLDPLRLSNDEFIVRNRRRALMNRVFDHSSSQVDEFLRIPEAERRMDLYRSQETIPSVHPNGYSGPGANLRDSQLQEGYSPTDRPQTQFVPGQSPEGSPLRPQRPLWQPPAVPALDIPQGGADSGSRSQPNGSGPGVIEPPPPQFIGPAAEPVPAPSPDIHGRASSPRPAEAGEVNRTSYLQPATQRPLPPAMTPSQRRRTPPPFGPADLRRLPRPDENARSN